MRKNEETEDGRMEIYLCILISIVLNIGQVKSIRNSIVCQAIALNLSR